MGIHRNDEKNKISFFLSAIKKSEKISPFPAVS